MAAAKKLVKFTITDAGHVLELTATREQVDLIDDTLEEILEDGDYADEVKD